VIFVCENNGYAEFTPLSSHTLVERLARHAQTYKIPSATVDGNDLLEVHDAMTKAAQHARTGKGPAFVECLTHRLRGHYEGDPAKYRELSELAEWKEKDPIARFTRELKRRKVVADKDIAAIENEARKLTEQAAQFALASRWPAPGEIASQVTA
jgi:acetoin:2,6-dichlorophenolindophenol oxidoreductase subunit alpha